MYFETFIIAFLIGSLVLFFFSKKDVRIFAIILFTILLAVSLFALAFATEVRRFGWQHGDVYYSCRDLGLNPFEDDEEFYFVEIPETFKRALIDYYRLHRGKERLGTIQYFVIPADVTSVREYLLTDDGAPRDGFMFQTDKDVTFRCSRHSVVRK